MRPLGHVPFAESAPRWMREDANGLTSARGAAAYIVDVGGARNGWDRRPCENAGRDATEA